MDPAVAALLTVGSIRYKPGWRFKLGGPLNSMMCVYAWTVDASNMDEHRQTQHQFTIPDGLDDKGFARWVYARLLDCERHELGEFLEIDGAKPFFPNHAEGDPYEYVERWETS